MSEHIGSQPNTWDSPPSTWFTWKISLYIGARFATFTQLCVDERQTWRPSNRYPNHALSPLFWRIHCCRWTEIFSCAFLRSISIAGILRSDPLFCLFVARQIAEWRWNFRQPSIGWSWWTWYKGHGHARCLETYNRITYKCHVIPITANLSHECIPVSFPVASVSSSVSFSNIHCEGDNGPIHPAVACSQWHNSILVTWLATATHPHFLTWSDDKYVVGLRLSQCTV